MTIPEIFLTVWFLLTIVYLGDAIWKLWRRSERYPSLFAEVIGPLILILAMADHPWSPRDKIVKVVIVICVVTAVVLRAVGRKRFVVHS